MRRQGDVLSYDYHFNHFTTEAKVCKCGAEQCRGGLRAKTTADEGDAEQRKQYLDLQEVERRRTALKNKPEREIGSLPLFFNARWSAEDIEEVGAEAYPGSEAKHRCPS
jgi:hypothetical protein